MAIFQLLAIANAHKAQIMAILQMLTEFTYALDTKILPMNVQLEDPLLLVVTRGG